MTLEKIELEFDGIKFMSDIRLAMDTDSRDLRSIAGMVGVSASTLSRIDNGATPDMEAFMSICSKLELSPGEYFKRVRWIRSEE